MLQEGFCSTSAVLDTRCCSLDAAVSMASQFHRGQTGLQTACVIISNHAPEKAWCGFSLFIERNQPRNTQQEQEMSIMRNKSRALNAIKAGSSKDLVLYCKRTGKHNPVGNNVRWPLCILKCCSAGSGHLSSGV